jgi:DNA repair photolyase
VGDLGHIRIKKKAIEMLEQKLSSLQKKGTIGTGSMNDPYMPVEEEYCLVRQALEVIRNHKFPVHIITKSNGVLRDVDLIREIGSVYSAVSFTVTTTDDKLSKLIEPGAPVSSLRIQAMAALSNAGIYTGAVLTPVLPFITDTIGNISAIIHAVAKAGGRYIIAWMGMTQREGQREYYHWQLERLFPGLKQKYEKTFGMEYSCPSPDADKLYKEFRELCLDYKIAMKMNFYVPPKPSQLSLFE